MSDEETLDQSDLDSMLGDDMGDIGASSDDMGDLGDLGGDMDAGGGAGDLGDLGGMDDMDMGGGDLGGDVSASVSKAPAASHAPAAEESLTVSGANMEALLDVPLKITVELGRSRMPIQDILELGPGSVVELSRMVDEPIHILVNDKLVAKGDVVVVDENFGIKISSIISPAERLSQI